MKGLVDEARGWDVIGIVDGARGRTVSGLVDGSIWGLRGALLMHTEGGA